MYSFGMNPDPGFSFTAALNADSLAAQNAQSVTSGRGEASIRRSSAAVKTRPRKRRSRSFRRFYFSEK